MLIIITSSLKSFSFLIQLTHLIAFQSLRFSHPSGVTSHTEIHIPDHVSPEAQSLLTEVLDSNLEFHIFHIFDIMHQVPSRVEFVVKGHVLLPCSQIRSRILIGYMVQGIENKKK